MTSTELAGPGAVASPRVPVGMSAVRPGRAGAPRCACPECIVMPVRAVVRECALVRQFRKRSWWIRASGLIWCTIDPQINHRARINPADSSGYRTHELIAVEDVRGTREAPCAGPEGAERLLWPAPAQTRAPVSPRARSVRALEG